MQVNLVCYIKANMVLAMLFSQKRGYVPILGVIIIQGHYFK